MEGESGRLKDPTEPVSSSKRWGQVRLSILGAFKENSYSLVVNPEYQTDLRCLIISDSGNVGEGASSKEIGRAHV